jgi:hypothetical protein
MRRMTGAARALFCCVATFGYAATVAADSPPTPSSRQAYDDAWWTGPLLASSAATLPQGRFLIEPYLYDSVTTGHYDNSGERSRAARVDNYGSLTYLLYGVTDRVTIGLIPRFGITDAHQSSTTSGPEVGDATAQAQYRLTQFREGGWVPTASLVIAETFPTGKYDRLGDRPGDGLGTGAYATTLSIYSQYYFWMWNGRILRTRLDASYSVSKEVPIQGVSVYGTPAGFRGHASPGNYAVFDFALEYSLTRNWVVALDTVYQQNCPTLVAGRGPQQGSSEMFAVGMQKSSGTSESLAFAPAVEYNWNGSVGLIVGAKLVATGRNTSAVIIPIVAVNLVF